MLRKRSRSLQKDQNMGHPAMSATGFESYSQSDVMGQKHKTNSFFTVPGLFVGLSPKGSSDCDAVRSPTSPLDFRVFSNLGNPLRSPRSSLNGNQKSWDCSKVGLSIIDSLDDNTRSSGRLSRSSDCKNIIVGPQMRIKTPNFRNHVDSPEVAKSLPKNYAIFPHAQTKSSNRQKENSGSLFEIGEDPLEPEPFGTVRPCSLDSDRSFSTFYSFAHKPNSSSGSFCLEAGNNKTNFAPQFSGESPSFDSYSQTKLSSIPVSVDPSNGLIGSLSASEIELSEDYTCVISHGPNPKTTHIYGDCILECHDNELVKVTKIKEQKIDLPVATECSEISAPFPSNGFLSFCFSCKKKLDGKDIFMYRGEKAFCSLSCRAQEILIDEETEDSIDDVLHESPEDHGDDCT